MAANIPAQPTNAPTPGAAQAAGAVPVWTEAPASATLRVTTPQGFEVLLTNRANTMNLLLAQLAALETWLTEHNWTPAPTRSAAPAAQGNGNAQAETPPLCAIHKTPMTRRTKDGRSWWYCNEKLDTGEWCPYRPKS